MCLAHAISYSVPTSESATFFEEAKRGPRCTNCGILESRSASESARFSSVAAVTEGEAGSLLAAASDLAAAAAAMRSFLMSSGSTVTSARVKGASLGACM